MKVVLEYLRPVIWAPCYLVLSVVGPLFWSALCMCGVVLIGFPFAIAIYLTLRLACSFCSLVGGCR